MPNSGEIPPTTQTYNDYGMIEETFLQQMKNTVQLIHVDYKETQFI